MQNDMTGGVKAAYVKPVLTSYGNIALVIKSGTAAGKDRKGNGALATIGTT